MRSKLGWLWELALSISDRLVPFAAAGVCAGCTGTIFAPLVFYITIKKGVSYGVVLGALFVVISVCVVVCTWVGARQLWPSGGRKTPRIRGSAYGAKVRSPRGSDLSPENI